MIPEETQISMTPGEVEFRLETSGGIRVVKVWLATTTPRLSAWCEVIRDSGRTEIVPLSLFTTEMEEFIAEAIQILGKAKPPPKEKERSHERDNGKGILADRTENPRWEGRNRE